MKKLLILTLFITFGTNAQKCKKIMNLVKNKDYGTTYRSYNSDAISKVTFYTITENYKTLYFAVVCFKKKYSLDCNEYIYQVSSNTKLNYSMNYNNSAGKAFWKYIQPYNENLDCGANFN